MPREELLEGKKEVIRIIKIIWMLLSKWTLIRKMKMTNSMINSILWQTKIKLIFNSKLKIKEWERILPRDWNMENNKKIIMMKINKIKMI